MYQKQRLGWIYLSVLTSSAILPVLCYPGLDSSSQLQPHIILPEGRKFAEKQNPIKKATSAAPVEDRNDLDDVQTNQIPVSQQQHPYDAGFSWSSLLSSVMQMLFNPAGAVSGPSKSDAIDTDQQSIAQSPWTNILTVGLKILTAFLGGGQIAGNDGIDKVDNSPPMQFINIVVTLLDALKTSFSHRSTSARSLGKKDSISEAAMAGLAYFKGYMRTMKTSDDKCMQKIVCEASKECTDDLHQPNALYCQLGTYVTSTILQKTALVPYENIEEAGRRGRSVANDEECKTYYSSCKEN